MLIIINGAPHTLTATAPTIADLLTQLNMADKRIAVELNNDIAPRSQHSAIFLKENDRVEIVHAIGGG